MEFFRGKILREGKEDFLLGAEVHYFRIEPKLWSRVLEEVREAGCNMVSFYIPWVIHEPEEGLFDFWGRTSPLTNLQGWLNLVRDSGLFAFVRPGPYIYAELTAGGIPEWFFLKYPQASSFVWKRGRLKKVEKVASYLHPNFLLKVRNWYREVFKVLHPFFQTRKGPIAFVQLCNEVPGIQVWGEGMDRNPETLGIGKENGLFPSFLREKYKEISLLNKVYYTRFKSFEEISWEELKKARKERVEKDYEEFYYRKYIPRYFQKLTHFAEENGVDVGLVHNAGNPDWVIPLSPSSQKVSLIHFGVDNYYHLLESRVGARTLSFFCEYGAEVSKTFFEKPVIGWEIECGFWHDYPLVYSSDLYIWLLWHFISGFQGLNLYLFSGEKNPPGVGRFGTYHKYQAPLSGEGKRRAHFYGLWRAFKKLKEEFGWLKDFKPLYDLSLGVGRKDSGKNISHLLFMANLTYRVVDPAQEKNRESISKEIPLWVRAGKKMEPEGEKWLLNFCREGGRLILQKVCAREKLSSFFPWLMEKLKIKEGKKSKISKVKKGKEEIFVEEKPPFLKGEGEVLFETMEGFPAVMGKEWGRGKVIILPFNFSFKFHSQTKFIHSLLNWFGFSPLVRSEKLRGRVFENEEGKRKVVWLNYHPEKVKERVEVLGKKREVEIEPYEIKKVEL